MNIVLFDADEIDAPLALSDPRVRHLLEILRRRPGEEFDAGILDGPLGKARIGTIGEASLTFSFEARGESPPLDPISLVVGLPRPQTARKILEEASALGVAAIHFVSCDRGEPGYARSKLWSTCEWRQHVIAGISQAFSTRLPEVRSAVSLQAVVAALPAEGTRLALDNYESSSRLSASAIASPATLCIGPEPGWSAAERDLLRSSEFLLVDLGPRVLRVETACTAAIALVKARLGSL